MQRRVLFYAAMATVFTNSLLLPRRPRIVSLEVHLWAGYAAAGLMLAAFCLWATDVAGFLRRWRRHANGRCPHCSYDLRASGARCPECGLEQRVVRRFGQYATYGK